VLHGTNPELGRLARSCWRHPDAGAWCGWCWNCSHNYLHLVAQGVEPTRCGFETSPFDREVARRRYVLFAGSRSPVDEVHRDQELLAFLEAVRPGASGWAVDRFDRRYRREAERRETELRSRYLKPDCENPRTAPLRSAPLFEQAHAAACRLVAALPDALRDCPPRRVAGCR
jgi:hypothetical protein